MVQQDNTPESQRQVMKDRLITDPAEILAITMYNENRGANACNVEGDIFFDIYCRVVARQPNTTFIRTSPGDEARNGFEALVKLDLPGQIGDRFLAYDRGVHRLFIIKGQPGNNMVFEDRIPARDDGAAMVYAYSGDLFGKVIPEGKVTAVSFHALRKLPQHYENQQSLAD